MNQSKTALFRSRHLKGLVFLSPDLPQTQLQVECREMFCAISCGHALWKSSTKDKTPQTLFAKDSPQLFAHVLQKVLAELFSGDYGHKLLCLWACAEVHDHAFEGVEKFRRALPERYQRLSFVISRLLRRASPTVPCLRPALEDNSQRKSDSHIDCTAMEQSVKTHGMSDMSFPMRTATLQAQAPTIESGCSQTFWMLPYIPATILGHPTQKFPFSRGRPIFCPPPLDMEDSHPTWRWSDPKVCLFALFLTETVPSPWELFFGIFEGIRTFTNLQEIKTVSRKYAWNLHSFKNNYFRATFVIILCQR